MAVLCATFYVYSEVQLKFIRLNAILGPAAPRIHTPARYNLGVQNAKGPYRNENTFSMIAVKGGCKISLNMIKDHVWPCNKDEYNKPYEVIENT